MKLTTLNNVLPDVRTYKSHPLIVDSETLVGLEIELEEVRYPRGGMVNLTRWMLKADGSLKGDHGVEFIFTHPYAGYDIIAALDELINNLDKNGIVPVCSPRTSVHVHIDVRNATLKQIVSFGMYYAIFEKMLYNWSGKDRYDNIFCVPLREVMSPFTALRRMLEFEQIEAITGRPLFIADVPFDKLDEYNRFFVENKRYCGFNLVSLATLGSIEFRMHEGTYEKNTLIDWINILLLLKKYAFAYEGEIENIPKLFSAKGIFNVTQDVFGEYARSLIYHGYEDDCLDNLRHANLLFTDPQVSDNIVLNYLRDTGGSKYQLCSKVIKRQELMRNKLINKTAKKEV